MGTTGGVGRTCQAETDEATGDPTLASALQPTSQGQVDGGIFMGYFGACLERSLAGGTHVGPLWMGTGVVRRSQPLGWTTLDKFRLMREALSVYGLHDLK